jgi:hypothetical protein
MDASLPDVTSAMQAIYTLKEVPCGFELWCFSVFAERRSALAQTDTGRISGPSQIPGGVVPGDGRRDVGCHRRREQRSRMRAVRRPNAPATYTSLSSGFKSVKTSVWCAAATRRPMKLEVGNVSEQVNVTASRSRQHPTPQFQTTINSQQLVELPTLTRNPYDLVSIAGNVHDVNADEVSLVGGVGRGTGFSINGGRSASTNILLDGGDNNNQFDTSVGQEIPLDAVQEFSVITNNYSAVRTGDGRIESDHETGRTSSWNGYELPEREDVQQHPDNEANNTRRTVQAQSMPVQPVVRSSRTRSISEPR